MNDKLLLKNTKMNQINSVTRGKMRQLSYYEFENQRGRQPVCEIYKKNDKKKPWLEWKRISFMCDLLIFSSSSFSYEFGNILNYFWGNDLSFFSLLIKLFGHFNLSILKISTHFKWVFREYQKCGGIPCYFVWDKWDIRILIGWRI